MCFIARAPDGGIAGVVQCWTSAFVKDLAVHPSWRRQGLGSALLLNAFQVFREREALSVALKVKADNVSAIRLYQRHGITPDRTRA